MPIVDARVLVVWSTPGGSAVNTGHIRIDDAVTTPLQAAEAIRDAFETHVYPFQANEVSLDEVQVGDDDLGAVAPGSGVGGLNFGTCVPGVSFSVTKVCNSGRNGRWFIPGVTENATFNNGSITNRDALQAAMVQFLADCENAGVDWRVRQKDGSYVQVDAFNVKNFVGIQTRRLRRARS